MGFRSTFAAPDSVRDWPAWFVEKWADTVSVQPGGLLVPLSEFKADYHGPMLHEDIRRALDWEQRNPFVIVYLHECRGITRVEITRDGVAYTEPEVWRAVAEVTHSYCYGCSDASKATA